MRIELPNPSWADTLLRADEDAHTLTVAPQGAADRLVVHWEAGEPAQTLRASIGAAPAVPLTLTL